MENYGVAKKHARRNFLKYQCRLLNRQSFIRVNVHETNVQRFIFHRDREVGKSLAYCFNLRSSIYFSGAPGGRK